jgi:hypothetical protein
MNLRLLLLRTLRPRAIMRKSFEDLFGLTAGAFGRKAPDLRAMPWAECLRQYAVFTTREVERAQGDGTDIALLKERLCRGAAAFGDTLRKRLRIRSLKEAREGLAVLYSAIGIDLQADAAGSVSVSRCYFSRYYTPEICRVVSALDEGLAAGLTGGGRLQFTQRITEGSVCCRAVLAAAGGGT